MRELMRTDSEEVEGGNGATSQHDGNTFQFVGSGNGKGWFVLIRKIVAGRRREGVEEKK